MKYNATGPQGLTPSLTAAMIVILALVSTPAGAGELPAGQAQGVVLAQASRPSGTLADITFSFKVDPRLTRSMYMGDRWISPAKYTTTAGQGSVEVQARGRDGHGRHAAIEPEWISSDPAMVTVSPGRGDRVTITVHRPGESILRVMAQGTLVKELGIRAWQQNSSIQAEITQKPLQPGSSPVPGRPLSEQKHAGGLTGLPSAGWVAGPVSGEER